MDKFVPLGILTKKPISFRLWVVHILNRKVIYLMVRPYICNKDVIYIEKDNCLIGTKFFCINNKELAMMLTHKFNGYNVITTCFKKLNNAESFCRFFNKFLNVK